MNLLRNIFYPPITLERFNAIRAAEPRRICFSSTHKSALKRSFTGKAFGFLNLPFTETISEFLPWKLFRNTKGNFGGYYRLIRDEGEFDAIKTWVAERSDLVFIRSALTTAVAVCEHYKDADHRSEIGELEHSAKYNDSATAKQKLADILSGTAQLLYEKHQIDAVACVPPSTAGAVGLPQFLASDLADRMRYSASKLLSGSSLLETRSCWIATRSVFVVRETLRTKVSKRPPFVPPPPQRKIS